MNHTRDCVLGAIGALETSGSPWSGAPGGPPKEVVRLGEFVDGYNFELERAHIPPNVKFTSGLLPCHDTSNLRVTEVPSVVTVGGTHYYGMLLDMHNVWGRAKRSKKGSRNGAVPLIPPEDDDVHKRGGEEEVKDGDERAEPPEPADAADVDVDVDVGENPPEGHHPWKPVAKHVHGDKWVFVTPALCSLVIGIPAEQAQVSTAVWDEAFMERSLFGWQRLACGAIRVSRATCTTQRTVFQLLHTSTKQEAAVLPELHLPPWVSPQVKLDLVANVRIGKDDSATHVLVAQGACHLVRLLQESVLDVANLRVFRLEVPARSSKEDTTRVLNSLLWFLRTVHGQYGHAFAFTDESMEFRAYRRTRFDMGGIGADVPLARLDGTIPADSTHPTLRARGPFGQRPYRYEPPDLLLPAPVRQRAPCISTAAPPTVGTASPLEKAFLAGVSKHARRNTLNNASSMLSVYTQDFGCVEVRKLQELGALIAARITTIDRARKCDALPSYLYNVVQGRHWDQRTWATKEFHPKPYYSGATWKGIEAKAEWALFHAMTPCPLEDNAPETFHRTMVCREYLNILLRYGLYWEPADL